jgi:hypothetical protein
MAVSAPEHSAITEVVQLYIDGSRLGDADKLRRAFHPDTRNGFWESLSFTDFFSLSRIDGEWKIVNKTFAHTGGEPPAH